VRPAAAEEKNKEDARGEKRQCPRKKIKKMPAEDRIMAGIARGE
jgi:hypothetical protein